MADILKNLVIESRVKDYVKEQGGADLRVAGDFSAKLDEKVQELLKDAVNRAKENGRKTLQTQDL
jgi:histone H3/H4